VTILGGAGLRLGSGAKVHADREDPGLGEVWGRDQRLGPSDTRYGPVGRSQSRFRAGGPEFCP
jgi:hypothetical protein